MRNDSPGFRNSDNISREGETRDELAKLKERLAELPKGSVCRKVIRNEFPSVKGFSTTNLWYMKKWYLFYGEKTDYQKICVIGVNDQKLHQLGGGIAYEKLHQSGGEMPELFGYIPWRHHVEIITKCSDIDEAVFYLRKTVQEGWNRNALLNAMEAELYKKSGGAITNFEQYLPSVQSKLAQEITKETYDLGFITLPPEYDEKDLEDALERNITQFLLELGTGFAFVGRQKEIIVSGKTRKIDIHSTSTQDCYIRN